MAPHGVNAERAKQNELARTVLIELMSHQFCHPVQWIDTQDLILDNHSTERLIELGPGNTLANMARRTVALKYQTKDLAMGMQRQLLDFNQSLEAITYDHPLAEEPPSAPLVEKSVPHPAVKPVETEVAKVPEPTAPSTITATQQQPSEFTDAQPSARDVVRTIVSSCLKKPLSASHDVQSIKALCMGRSTLQNETIGDLAAEFDSLPDGAEDLTLDDLSEAVQRSYTGKLGKKTTSLMDRLSSLKLPRELPLAKIREHLQQRWGLKLGRQNSVILQAVREQPEDRLTETEARALFDRIARQYMSDNGLEAPKSNSSGPGNAAAALVSSEALRELEDRQQAAWRTHLAMYNSLLNNDSDQSQSLTEELQKRILEQEQELNGWAAEHGEAYARGVSPMFSPLKARIYDSWRNWALEDVLRLASGQCESPGLVGKSIANRAHPRLISALRYLTETIQDSDLTMNLNKVLSECEMRLTRDAAVLPAAPSMIPVTSIDAHGNVVCGAELRPSESNTSSALRLGRKTTAGYVYQEDVTAVLESAIAEVQQSNLSLAGKTALVTGAGSKSIGRELIAQMVSAGARVIVTTSSYSRETAREFQEIYARFGGKGSKLILVPFNQACVRDINALVQYIYDEKTGLGLDLDIVVCFAALSENGRTLADIDSRSELAHRLMLTNCLRLLGAVKQHKANRGILCRPAQVIVPLSPNHGAMGGDGLYAESKLGLEALFEKFHSEDWADYLLISGVSIGWTRGTGLTNDHDVIAAGMEKLGIRTFSAAEMASNILALMSSSIVSLCVNEPVMADFSGGMADFVGIKEATTRIRAETHQISEEREALEAERLREEAPAHAEPEPQATFALDPGFPALPDWDTEIAPLAPQLNGMVDLERVVVVAGFSEVGPWSSARVRWDMEINHRLSVQSCIELAWCMGLIKNHSDPNEHFVGWLDVATGQPIADAEIRAKYESFILEHAGIRLMEPNATSSCWDKEELLHEVEITTDHEPFETSRDVALHLKLAHGEHAVISPVYGDEGRSTVKLKKGAKIKIPKLAPTPHTVGGQLPTNWRADKYGVPDEIVRQVDPATLYALVSAAETLHSAGLDSAYELYNDIHVSDVANCVGSGIGGGASLQAMFKGRYRDEDVAKDILGETFISSGAAWINMLLLSASGANKTPVGACATATESLDTAFDLIQSGKAKVCLVGAFEDTVKHVSDEFDNLGATVNPAADAARGREPSEMSRPATSSRAGFVEAQGAGIQLVTSAKVALDLGLPIYGVISLTMTAMDKAGRSIPAPGRGLLGAARQKSGDVYDSPLMNMAYRRRLLNARLQQVDEFRNLELDHLQEELEAMHEDEETKTKYEKERLEEMSQNAARDAKDARWQFGNNFWTHDDRIAPMRGALGTWGLTVEDIDVISFHGTSTTANEKNEISLTNHQLAHLGRKEGNLLPGVFQKSLTGHSKGPAGAWMLNGCLQMLRDGVVPGISTADNIDPTLEKDGYIVFPRKAITRPNMRAFAMQLFGFGQKGAMAVGVHARYLFATMAREDYESYSERARLRQRQAARRFHDATFGGAFFRAKDEPPYKNEEEISALLNPDFRLKARA